MDKACGCLVAIVIVAVVLFGVLVFLSTVFDQAANSDAIAMGLTILGAVPWVGIPLVSTCLIYGLRSLVYDVSGFRELGNTSFWDVIQSSFAIGLELGAVLSVLLSFWRSFWPHCTCL